MAERMILSVTELTGALKEVVETTFQDIWVEGELSNIKHHGSGHLYFTLKDGTAQISCAMWQFMRQYLFFTPQEGMKVRAHGAVSLYPPRGTYSLIIKSMRPAGEGDLYQAYETLRIRLAAEGLFDARHKQTLPRYPARIGVITSGTGAAVRDILSVLERRYPVVTVQVMPVQVQGAGAAEQIARAIYAFNLLDEKPDVLIVGRGGGSIEDLWAFNEEAVARAMYHSEIPIISAVGHETDVTIADFAADVRAATPSQAAELAVPDITEVRQYVRNLRYTIQTRVEQHWTQQAERLQAIVRSYGFNRPRAILDETEKQLTGLRQRLTQQTRFQHERATFQAQSLAHQLALLHPLKPLEKGFVLVDQGGKRVSDAADLQSGDVVRLRFRDGEHKAEIQPPEATMSIGNMLK